MTSEDAINIAADLSKKRDAAISIEERTHYEWLLSACIEDIIQLKIWENAKTNK